jgi:primosomal protein N' (replication factor Y) (superfamily II helicase)
MHLKKYLGDCVLGPDVPVISRLQGWYLRNLLIKIDRAQSVSGVKKKIAEGISILVSTSGFTNLVVQSDVDPY